MRWLGWPLILLAACYVQSSGKGGPVDLTVQVVDSTTKKPMADSLVALELGGIYLPISDTSKGNPHYTLATKTDADGKFTMHLNTGPIGVHTFQDNYNYGRVRVDPYDNPLGVTVLEVEPLGTALVVKPSATNFAAVPIQVSAEGSITFSAQLTHASWTDQNKVVHIDPLSDEVLLIEPTTQFVRAMDPPTPGVQGQGFPDGTWKTTINAPKAPGKYTYSLVISSENCVVSDRKTVDVVVQ